MTADPWKSGLNNYCRVFYQGKQNMISIDSRYDDGRARYSAVLPIDTEIRTYLD